MATWLKNTISITPPLNPAAFQDIPHRLIDPYGVRLVPDLVAADNVVPAGTSFTVFATPGAEDVSIRVTNTGAVPITSLNIYVESWHTLERTFGSDNTLNLPIQPFYILGGNGSGGVGPVVDLQQAYDNGLAASVQRIVEGLGGRLEVAIQARAGAPDFSSIFRVENIGGAAPAPLEVFVPPPFYLNGNQVVLNGSVAIAGPTSAGQKVNPGLTVAGGARTNEIPLAAGFPGGDAKDVYFALDTVYDYDPLAIGPENAFIQMRIDSKTLNKTGGAALTVNTAAMLYLESGNISTGTVGIAASWQILTDYTRRVPGVSGAIGNSWFRGPLLIGDLDVLTTAPQSLAFGGLTVRMANAYDGGGAQLSPDNAVTIWARDNGALPRSDARFQMFGQVFNSGGAAVTANAAFTIGGSTATGVMGIAFEDSIQLSAQASAGLAVSNVFAVGTTGVDTSLVIGTAGGANTTNVIMGVESQNSFELLGASLINVGLMRMIRRLETRQGANIAAVNPATTLGPDGNVFILTGDAITIEQIPITDWQEGSVIILIADTDNGITLAHAAGGGNLFLNGGVNQVMASGSVIQLVRVLGAATNGWFQVAPMSQTGVNP